MFRSCLSGSACPRVSKAHNIQASWYEYSRRLDPLSPHRVSENGKAGARTRGYIHIRTGTRDCINNLLYHCFFLHNSQNCYLCNLNHPRSSGAPPSLRGCRAFPLPRAPRPRGPRAPYGTVPYATAGPGVSQAGLDTSHGAFHTGAWGTRKTLVSRVVRRDSRVMK